MNIAILGGAFDPPTIGHIKLAQFVLNNSVFDKVHLMPCHSHMYGKQMASPNHRLQMCKLAAQDDSRIIISDLEITNKHSGSTYELIKLIEKSELSQHKFSIIIGMDNANTFYKWFKYKELMEIVSFVVVARKGIISEVDWYKKEPHICFNIESDIPMTSSTEVKECIRNGDSEKRLKDLLDKRVLEYIIHQDLYESKGINS